MLNRISIYKRLLAAFVLTALIGAAVGGVGLFSTSRMNERAQLGYEQDLTGLKFASRAETAVAASGRALEAAILATDEAARKDLLADARRYHADARAALEKAVPLFDNEQGRGLSGLAQAMFGEYGDAFEDLAKAVENQKVGDNAHAATLLFGPYATRRCRWALSRDGR